METSAARNYLRFIKEKCEQFKPQTIHCLIEALAKIET